MLNTITSKQVIHKVNGTSRKVSDRLDDAVSVKDFAAVGNGVTTDQTAVANAVAHCYSNGKHLYWPKGTYLTTDTIPNFHSIKHFGPGIVKRGTDLFYVEPRNSQANTLYIATTGSSSSDGLSASEPMATFQNGFDTLANYGPVLDGIWTVSAAAGTYSITTGYHVLTNIKSRNRVVIKGPAAGHPNVPTCIVDGGSTGANYTHGIGCTGDGLLVTVQDIKFRNFSGDPAGNSRGGLLFDNGCDAYTNNVHADNCSWFGIYYSRRTSGRHQGGIINNCRNGVLTDGSKCTVGYGASSLTQGTQITNCTESGIYWCRGTDGHVDYCTVDSNAVGLVIDSASRVDSVGTNYKKNTIGVRCANGGRFGDNPYTPSNFNIGTADANTQAAIEYKAGSGESGEGFTSETWTRVAYDRSLRTASGTTPAVLATPYTIAAGRMQGTGKSCRVMVYGIYTITNGSTLTVKFGGMTLALTAPAGATSEMFILDVTLHDIAGGYRAFGELRDNLTAGRLGTASTGFTNTSSQAVSVECALAGSGDSVSIYRTDVYLIG